MALLRHAAALVLGLGAVACGRPAGVDVASIAALGDSITAGYSTEAYPDRLGEWRRVPVHNFGVAADTTAGMRARLPQVLASGPTPQLVIVLGGTNDVARGWPVERTMANLEAIAGTLREAGRTTVIVCPPPAGVLPEPALRSLRHAVREYARGHGLRVVDPWAAMEDRTRPGHMRRELALDGVHPNERGQRVLAREIAHVLGWASADREGHAQ